MSDLHVDVRRVHDAPYLLPTPPKRPDYDVMIVAGDLREDMERSVAWLIESDLRKPVIYVGGNHDFYRCDRHDALMRARQRAHGTNVRVLQNDAVTICGVTFVGATLWTDYKLDKKPANAMATARASMNDHRLISCGGGTQPWLPQDCASEHKQSVRFIGQTLDARGREPVVVVTHHAPSARSVPCRYAGQTLNAAFASRLDRLVSKADLWVHGHTHDRFDYMIGGARVVCNPRGYVMAGEGKDFDERLTVDVCYDTAAGAPHLEPKRRRS